MVAIAGAVGAGYFVHGSSQLATVAVLHASRNIVPGTLITNDELGISQVATPDTSALSNLVLQKDAGNIVGRVAAVGVRAGSLVPANVAAVDPSSAFWTVNLPVRRMPATLQAGDRVALMVSRQSDNADVVLIQDIAVVAVQPGAADLMLPPNVVAQMQWYADHGGVVLLKMPAGSSRSGPLVWGPQGG